MKRRLLIAVAVLAMPGAAMAEGCFYGHGAVKDTVAEAQPQQSLMPEAEGTLVASLTDCTTLTGDALVQCLAAQAAK